MPKPATNNTCTCKAILYYENGVSVACSAPAALDNESGMNVCYLHDKYAVGLTGPVDSPHPEERITHMRVRGVGDFIRLFPRDPFLALADEEYEVATATA